MDWLSYPLALANANLAESNERNRLKYKHEEDRDSENNVRFYIPQCVLVLCVDW